MKNDNSENQQAGLNDIFPVSADDCGYDRDNADDRHERQHLHRLFDLSFEEKLDEQPCQNWNQNGLQNRNKQLSG